MNVFDLLRNVYGAKGLPFPRPPKKGDGTAVAGQFFGEFATNDFRSEGSAIASNNDYALPALNDKANQGNQIRKYDDSHLGTYQFLPASIVWYNSQTKKKVVTDLPNALVIISGEKEIVETTIVDVGTVFEQVFVKPYTISIIATLIGDKGLWPQSLLQDMNALWQENAPVTLRCALTDVFLNKQVNGSWVNNAENNFIIHKIGIMDNQGAENVEVIQIDGMSNIDFELELA